MVINYELVFPNIYLMLLFTLLKMLRFGLDEATLMSKIFVQGDNLRINETLGAATKPNTTIK